MKIITLCIAMLITRVLADPRIADVDGASEIHRVGLFALQACTTNTTDEACMQNVDMVEALEADDFMSGERTICFRIDGIRGGGCEATKAIMSLAFLGIADGEEIYNLRGQARYVVVAPLQLHTPLSLQHTLFLWTKGFLVRILSGEIYACPVFGPQDRGQAVGMAQM